jgi:hypothetical protein
MRPPSSLRSTLRNAEAAAVEAGDDSRRWLPGALAALAFLGWLPFVLAVVPLPSAGDLAFLGANLYTRPLTAVGLALAVVTLIALAGLLAALGAIVVLRQEAVVAPARSTPLLARVWAAQLLSSIPLLAAAVACIAALAVVAPAEYQSPDIGGPVEWRIARDLAPLIVLLVVAVLLGQLFGAAATRRLAGGASLRHAALDALRDLRQRPLRAVAVAVLTMLVQLIGLGASFALLRILWAPIRLQLANGLISSPPTILLLVGFVAIWLCLLIAAGVVFAWASAWWTKELEAISRA